MKVFGHPLSTCTRKVLMTLAEKGAVADFIPVDLFSAEQKKPPHLARHPFGVVPVLEDDGGFVLLESRAILRYLDRKLPGASLTPSDPTEAARMDQWLSVDQSYVAPHTRALAVQRILRKHEGLLPEPGAEQAAEAALATAFGVFEEALRGSPHSHGRVVHARRYLACSVRRELGHAGLGAPSGEDAAAPRVARSDAAPCLMASRAAPGAGVSRRCGRSWAVWPRPDSR